MDSEERPQSRVAEQGVQIANAQQTIKSLLLVSPRRADAKTRIIQFIFAVCLLLYSILALLAHKYAYFGWDLSIARFIQSITLAGFGPLMTFLSVLGSGWVPFAMTVGTGLIILFLGLRVQSIVLMAGTGLGSLMDNLLKVISDRPRPAADLVHIIKHYHGDSFPSGHVVFFVEFFGFVLILLWTSFKSFRGRRILMALCAIAISLIGVSRIYLGAHWPSDVVGAYLAGAVWLMIMVEVSRRFGPQKKAEENG